MKRRLTVLLLALAICHSAPAVTAAQDQSQSPANLSLQMFFGQSQAPSYVSVEPGGTLWHTHFQRTPGWKEREGTLPLKAVVISRRRDGDYAVVGVTLKRGERFYDTSEFVAEHRARLGDSVTVGELAKFGVVPFRFKVVRRVKAALPEVGVTNLTHSIEVVSAEVTDDKSIGVKLVLRNLSPKRVMGLELHVLSGGRDGAIAWPIGTEGKALIEPGGTYERRLGFESLGEEVAGGYVPDIPDTVKVTSVLFADGSYEGESLPAAKNAGNLTGYRLQLVRVLGLFKDALNSPGTNAAEAVAKFRKEVSDLNREADPSVVEELVSKYPGLEEGERSRLKDSVEVAMHWLRQDVLNALNAFERQSPTRASDRAFREWLAAQQTYFEKWLGSLTP